MGRIVLGVGGGIAAYKAVHLARELQRRGHDVKVVLTDAAQRFVGALTFAGVSGERPVTDLWDRSYAGEVHVVLAQWAEAIVVAPATANLMARMHHGLADDALSATLLCFDGPIVLAPAMHHRMWARAATQRNVEGLRAEGVRFVGPLDGPLASGESGMGRMAEPEAIADALGLVFVQRDLHGRAILVSAGPTHEAIDPVRFLGNRSSGKMGYATAERAAARGARVILVSGPSALACPFGVELVRVRSAREMEAAIAAHRENVDAIVMAAAVADYRPAEERQHKMKKGGGAMTLELVPNPDILAGLGGWRRGTRPMLVGFAVETENLIDAARKKLTKKNVDLIVANEASVAFEGDTNRVVLVTRGGEETLPELTKQGVADRILDRIVDHLGA